MNYQILPMGKAWENGMFSVPCSIAKNYIKLASEYQLKTLLLILSNNGQASSKEIAKTLGCTESDADDFLEFWVDEGIVVSDMSPAPAAIEKKETASEIKPKSEKKESLPVPTLDPKAVIDALHEDEKLVSLLQTAEEVKGKPLSHVEKESLINIVQYYGLPYEIALTIFQYYIKEKASGRALGMAYLGAMAKNWSEEGITTLSAADEKLREIEGCERFWKEVLELASIQYRNPTVKQTEMIKTWKASFSIDMIAFACDLMKENADKPTLKYVNKVLQNWQKAGIKTLDEAKADNEAHRAKNETQKSDKLQGKPSFDISEIEKKAMFDDNYDI